MIKKKKREKGEYSSIKREAKRCERKERRQPGRKEGRKEKYIHDCACVYVRACVRVCWNVTIDKFGGFWVYVSNRLPVTLNPKQHNT